MPRSGDGAPVDGAQEKAKAVEGGDERAKAGCNDADSASGKGGAEHPSHRGGQLAGCHWEEGLVHGIDVDVKDLIDADDVSVATQESEKAKEGPRQEGPVDCLGGARSGSGEERKQ